MQSQQRLQFGNAAAARHGDYNSASPSYIDLTEHTEDTAHTERAEHQAQEIFFGAEPYIKFMVGSMIGIKNP